MRKSDALIVVDVQNDFCPGGALAVEGGDLVVPVINGIMGGFRRVAGTQDWHPRNHSSFASSHPGRKPFEQLEQDGTSQTLWPDHCVAGTAGAAFHPGLDADRFNLVVRKGSDPAVDSYSAFLDNDKKTATGLAGYLKEVGAGMVYLCGLATNYCVFFSAMDAVSSGFRVTVIIDACRGIDVPAGSIDRSISDMKRMGVRIIESKDL